MEERKLQQVAALSVAVLTVLSFVVSYYSFYNAYFPEGSVTTKEDKLSGTTYSTDDIHNYRDANRYGSAFIGFEQLTQRGIPDDSMRYIQDAILNFTMYEKKIYNGRISYIDTSFKRHTISGIEPKYEFRFGINDSNFHTVNVESSIYTKKISIIISDENTGSVKFSRTFDIRQFNDSTL